MKLFHHLQVLKNAQLPTMNPPRDIPGFYFDEEKNKYFAIQASHKVPAGSKYTSSAVAHRNKIKSEVLRKERVAREEQARKPIAPLIRSKILQTFLGHDLIRSIGNVINDNTKEKIIESHLKCFGKKDIGNSPEGSPEVAISLWNGWNHDCGRYNTITREIHSFVWDSHINRLYLTYAARSHPEHGELNHHIWCVNALPHNPFRVHPLQRFVGVPFRSKVKGTLSQLGSFNPSGGSTSRMALTPRGAVISTTISGSSMDDQFRLYPGRQAHQNPPTITHLDNNPMPTSSSLFKKFTTGPSTLWCSAPNPFGSADDTTAPEKIAFGTSKGIIIGDTIAGLPVPGEAIFTKTYSDPLSLEWMGPNTVAAGLRNAGILLYDLRSEKSVVRLRHATAVIKMARADEEGVKLVACGFPHVMSMYDLRMVKEVVKENAKDLAEDWRKTREDHGVPGNEPFRIKGTEPLFDFNYVNETTFNLGFDICRSWGLLAAAQDDRRIRIYSLRTGKILKELVCTKVGAFQGQWVRCLQFVDDDKTGLRLLASQNKTIYQFGVHSHDDIESGVASNPEAT
jgi:hypothetical protein